MLIMNFQCQIMHYDEAAGEIFNRPVDAIESDKAVRLAPFVPAKNLADSFIYDDQAIVSWRDFHPALGEITLSYDPTKPCVAVRDAAGKYLCWDLSRYSFSRDVCDVWEYFLLLDEEFIGKIRYILANDWVSKRTATLYKKSDICLEPDFTLRLGAFRLNLRLQDKADFSDYVICGVSDDWKPEVFFVFRPLVYITAYASKTVLDQLHICVRSLRDIGRFDQKIVVMTDRSRDEILRLCEECESDPTEVDPSFPKDFVGFVSSKYSIFDKDVYRRHQPLMYLDPDIVFDRPVEDMLVAALVTEQICAPLEDWHRLKTHPPVGATLIQLDQLEPGSYAAGFNGGTIVIPNTADPRHRRSFELVARTITHVGLKFGRGFNPWADQEVANYIAYKVGGWNTAALTRFVHYIENDAGQDYNRSGLTHFWGHAGPQKVEKMLAYLTDLYRVYGMDRSVRVK